MEVAIRNIGKSKGVVLPKPLLAQVGLDRESMAQIEVANGSSVLRKQAKAVRAGWAEAAAAVCAKGEDALLMGEFSNADDGELAWPGEAR